MFCTWMQDNKTDCWSELCFIQFMKNRVYSGIKRTSYKAPFGCKPEVGLASYVYKDKYRE